MKKNVAHYKVLEAWSRDALVLLQAAGLSPALAKMQLDIIDKNSGAKAIYVIAEDLAEGLSELDSESREVAQAALVKKYGFGFGFFTDAKMRQVQSVLKRGRIRNEDECRALLDVASDTTIDQSLRDALAGLLAEYEGAQERPDRD
jgi:hypothetical protein